MSVIVKGMPMPGSCYQCNFCVNVMDGEDLVVVCTALEKEIIALGAERQDDCPLIEVPQHGRLIDADAIPYIFGSTHATEYDTVTKFVINKLPTIIEGDGKE